MTGAKGFTLIEMLVALAVFSIAALAILHMDGFALSTAASLTDRAGAQLVAENEAALVLSDPAPPLVGTSTQTVTNGGRAYLVRRQVTPTADRRLVRVDLLAIDRGSGARSGRRRGSPTVSR